jgi:hypothetical protein
MKGRNSFTMSVDTSALNKQLQGIAEAIDGVVRPAAQAGAQVLYEEVKRNASRLGRVSGRLQNAIYQAFSTDNSSEKTATYHVSWRTKKGFIDDNGKKVELSRAPHGHLIEYGHLMPYRVVFNKKTGKFVTLRRPESKGKPPPSPRASKSVKDAYYMPWPDGKVRVAPPKPFVRPAAAKFGDALDAAEKKAFDLIREKL